MLHQLLLSQSLQHPLLRLKHPSEAGTFHLLCAQQVAPLLVEAGASVRPAEVAVDLLHDQRGPSHQLLVAVTRLPPAEAAASVTTGKHPPPQVVDTFPRLVVDKQMVRSASLHRRQRRVLVMENTGRVPLGAPPVSRVVI